MNAYFVLDFQVTDLNTFMEYVKKIPAFIQNHGGKYFVEGKTPQKVEGDWGPERLVILEFLPRTQHYHS